MIAPSGAMLALTSNELQLIHLHRPSMDPTLKSAPLASAARQEAARQHRVAIEGSDAMMVDDYEGEGDEDQEGRDSEDEDQYWSSFMQDDDAAASDAITTADDDWWSGWFDQVELGDSGSESD
jgi:hypothetical protein